MPYLEGGLGPRQAERLEKHMAACGDCAAIMRRIRTGHNGARRFGILGPALPDRLPEFDAIRARRPLARVLTPAVAAASLLVVAAGLAALFAYAGRIRRPPSGPAFARMSIREFEASSHSQVVTEGYVHSVYFDNDERTLHIKLSEVPQSPEPFVICEVHDPRKMTIPLEGSRIRVYGTARFDGQPGRGWNEVNPVMDIAVLDR
jgi:hypothetical protein